MLALDQVAMIIDSTATTGTNEVQLLGGAAPGYRTVNAVLSDLGLSLPIGVSYRIEDGAAWELGVGRITSDGYLERTTVMSSSAAGARINIVGNPDPAIMYIVACALSAPAVTPHVEAWSPAMGAQVREDIQGGTALGAGALVYEQDGTAIGAITGVYATGATAVGSRSQAGVMESVCSGFNGSHGVQWAGAATSTNEDPVPARSATGRGFAPPAGSAMLLDIQVVAFRTSPTNAMYAATMKAGVMRLTDSAAPVIIGATAPEVIAASAGVTCSIDIGVNSDPIESGRDQELGGAVDVLVTRGVAGETWRWAVVIRSAMHG